MRLTIIPADKAVYKNELCYANLNLVGVPVNVHALQWYDVSGWIEFNDETPNLSINVLPDWAVNAEAEWQVAYDKAHEPPLPPTAEQNKNVAVQKLQETDWATIPDVSDPTKSNPHLDNSQEFVTYRNAVRQYAINPIAGAIDWPIVPESIWVST
jgi:hypothetical protein